MLLIVVSHLLRTRLGDGTLGTTHLLNVLQGCYGICYLFLVCLGIQYLLIYMLYHIILLFLVLCYCARMPLSLFNNAGCIRLF